jgi:hypothetical protein
MAIHPISQETLDKTQSELRKEFASAFKPPKVINTHNTLMLGIDQRFLFAGKTFVIQPVSFRLGAQCQALMLQINEVKDLLEESRDANAAYVELCEQAADALWSGVIPLNPTLYFKKKFRIGKNPFRDMTDAEVAQLLDFFSRCRMLSRIQTKASIH